MRILVVEDEPTAAAVVAKGLREHAYAVDVAADGAAALDQLSCSDYDLLILDVRLPRINGLDLCHRLRADDSAIPVLMLTARGGLDDRVQGLDAGADDYLAKPYHFPELLARVRTLLKRNQAVPADPVVRVADLEIDPVRHRATRSGRRVDLSAKEFALLSLLAQKAGQVLSRTKIASLVWDIHFDSDTNVVEVAVRRLRAKIDDPFEEKLIHTVRGVGYVLERRS